MSSYSNNPAMGESAPRRPILHDTYVLDGVMFTAESYLDRPLVTVDQQDEPQLLEDWRKQLIGQHNAVMALPSAETTADLSRARAFIIGLGGPVKDIKVLDTANFEHATDLMPVSKSGVRVIDVIERGLYHAGADISLVKSEPNSEAERLNGQTMLEVTAVHELAHAWGSTHIENTNTVIGFRSLPLEEAWATYIEGRYVAQVLGVPAKNPAVAIPVPERILKYSLQTVTEVDGHKQPGLLITPEAYSAAIIEHCIDRDPEIFTLLCEARNDTRKLALVQQHIDTLSPGLYDKLESADSRTIEGRRALRRLEHEVMLSILPLGKRIVRAIGEFILDEDT
jgi:hypothetical protein